MRCICQTETEMHRVCLLDELKHNEYRPLQENCDMV